MRDEGKGEGGTGKEGLVGAHVSIAGGLALAPARGAAVGATAIQVFTKTPNQWREPPVGEAQAAAFRAALVAHGIRAVVAHDSYLINLASPDRALWRRSLRSFTAELARCRALVSFVRMSTHSDAFFPS